MEAVVVEQVGMVEQVDMEVMGMELPGLPQVWLKEELLGGRVRVLPPPDPQDLPPPLLPGPPPPPPPLPPPQGTLHLVPTVPWRPGMMCLLGLIPINPVTPLHPMVRVMV